MGFFHKKLTDKQYTFCEFYCFGLPIPSSVLEAYNVYYLETPDAQEKLKRELNYRKADNYLKYLYHNATGSYYHAFKGSSYETAKINGYRLLKDPRIIQEILFMEEFIGFVCRGIRCYDRAKYISPDTNLYDIRGKDKDLFLKTWNFKK